MVTEVQAAKTPVVPEKPPAPDSVSMDEAMKRELRQWGIGLIVLAIIHFVLSEYLDPTWGGVILILGCFNLVIQKRGMFILNGISLMGVGILNIIGGSWTVFGFLQIYWGFQELGKFGKYDPANELATTS